MPAVGPDNFPSWVFSDFGARPLSRPHRCDILVQRRRTRETDDDARHAVERLGRYFPETMRGSTNIYVESLVAN
jgi:hypothetical protein